MIIKIKLGNPKLCNRCKLLCINEYTGWRAFCGFYHIRFSVKEEEACSFKRPKKCIKENGL